MLASAPESREELTSGTSYSPPPAFGRFKLLHQIGAGVLGPVFRTHDPEHDRLVAVKAFTPRSHSRAGRRAGGRVPALGRPRHRRRLRGRRQSRPASRSSCAYLAVPYVSGESLDAAIRQYGPAPAGDATRLIAHVAEALDAAAHAGVLSRLASSAGHSGDAGRNPRDRARRGEGAGARRACTARSAGRTSRPERESGDEWGAAADIYALAAIAYEVLTGRRALPGNGPAAARAWPISRSTTRRRCATCIEAALDPDPARRPAQARDFAAGFAAALSESAGAAAPGERPLDRRAKRPRTKPPKLPGLDEPLTGHEGPPKSRAKGSAPAGPVAQPPHRRLPRLALQNICRKRWPLRVRPRLARQSARFATCPSPIRPMLARARGNSRRWRCRCPRRLSSRPPVSTPTRLARPQGRLESICRQVVSPPG